jgi:3'-5' exoribonuclease
MSHLFMNEVKPGMQLNEIYMVTQPVLRNTTRGDFYIAMFLSDRTGKANGRMWQATQEIYNSLPSEGFVRIRGKTELYQGAMQIIINDLIVVDPDDVDLEDFMPRSEKDIPAMFNELKGALSGIEDAGLKALIDSFLDDSELMQQFCTAPAAMQMHHAYLGGLLEHTHAMMMVAQSILPLYPKLQKDLVLAGVFLHDIAKTKELSYKIAFSYTESGQLLGHIVQGTQMIVANAEELAAKGIKVESSILNSLLHIIVSHHGQYDFGSPKLPATAEAFMISRLDDMDAKMNQVTGLIDNDPGDTDWTGYQRPLETRLYRKRPLAEGV